MKKHCSVLAMTAGAVFASVASAHAQDATPAAFNPSAFNDDDPLADLVPMTTNELREARGAMDDIGFGLQIFGYQAAVDVLEGVAQGEAGVLFNGDLILDGVDGLQTAATANDVAFFETIPRIEFDPATRGLTRVLNNSMNDVVFALNRQVDFDARGGGFDNATAATNIGNLTAGFFRSFTVVDTQF
ncbi:MAG: hypothetical protein AAGA09_02360 [Pseudomonadota bacterium]